MILKLWLAKILVYFYFIFHIQFFFLVNFRYVANVYRQNLYRFMERVFA